MPRWGQSRNGLLIWEGMTDEEIIGTISPPIPDIGLLSPGNSAETAQLEMMRRLTIALREFHKASDKASRLLAASTVALVVLTAAILWLTYELAQHPGAG